MTEEQKAFYRFMLKDHTAYWEDKKGTMRQWKAAYECRFWSIGGFKGADDDIQIETSYANSFIETYVSALFTKQPAVEVGADPLSTNAAPVIRTIVNRWLNSKRTVFEDATRMALIYPNAFIKLLANQRSSDLLNRIRVESVNPWDVIIDREASCWEQQRFVGHTYQMVLTKALELYGSKDYNVQSRKEFFDDDSFGRSDDGIPDAYKYIRIVEVYDFTMDKLIIWTPDHSSGFCILLDEQIPVRTTDDQPMSNLIPLTYNWQPDNPLQGMSAMNRIYDQVVEINHLRTHAANAVRKDVRKYLYNSSVMDEKTATLLISAEDYQFIGVEVPPGTPIENVVYAIPNAPISTNHQIYQESIMNDINRATLMAPFARGEAARTTATEISVLNSYTSSEVGKHSRQKDEAIENTANLYIRMLYTQLEDDDKLTVKVENQSEIIGRDDLAGQFVYVAQDQGSSPVNMTIRKNTLNQMAPMLVQLGASSESILREVVRANDLPESLGKVATPAQTPAVNIEKPPSDGELI